MNTTTREDPLPKIALVCKVEGCGQKHMALGFCNLHYLRVKKHGNAGVPGRLRAPIGSGWSDENGYKYHQENGDRGFEHSNIAEQAIGKPLPRRAVIHHVDENPNNNNPSNLVICPSQAYHMLLHQRQRALRATGHADWRKCPFCKQYDDPQLMTWDGNGYRHRKCHAAYQLQRRKFQEGKTAK